MRRIDVTHPGLAVAVSGGLDSTALLHCVARARAHSGLAVHALHVQHGLHADASKWADQAAAQCRRWDRRYGDIHFHQVRLSGQPGRGDSVEAWARRERYRALTRMCDDVGCRLLLLAHHRRDQAETVLLQALRGAGPAGLSAMPRVRVHNGITWVRPWLDLPHRCIEAYVARHRLRHVEDPANAQPRFARSRVRHEVLPLLEAMSAGAETTLWAVAQRAQEAQAVLEEVGRLDLDMAADGVALAIGRWRALSPARQHNLLRHWARAQIAQGLPESLLSRLMRELPAVAHGRWPAPGGELMVYRGRLTWLKNEPLAAVTEATLDLSRPGRYDLPASRGHLHVEVTRGPGVPRGDLLTVAVRPRSGDARFQSHRGGVPRTLKKAFQAAGIPAPQRGQSVLWIGDRLLFVPGLGTDARVLVERGDDLMALRWER